LTIVAVAGEINLVQSEAEKSAIDNIGPGGEADNTACAMTARKGRSNERGFE
jgi:hypothetical protein